MHWKEHMPKPVRDMEFAEYATSSEDRPVEVDCSLGTNPLGSPECVGRILPDGGYTDPCVYPGNDLAFRRAISDSWNGAFGPEDVILGTGSIGLIISIARTFCAPGSKVLGVTPQFPDGPMHFQFSGATYRKIALAPPDHRIDTVALIAAMSGDESLVYLDRPHNPTGQAPPLKEIEKLAAACRDSGSLLVLDEAYGDFLPPEGSGIMLEHSSVIVLRSFSKGRGLAGIRAGYAVVRDPEAHRFLRKVAPPFSVSSIAVDLASASLLEHDFLARSGKAVRSVKSRISQVIARTPGISAAETHPDVPIMLISSNIPGENLYESLIDQGIRTEPGICFEGLGPQSVRLRVPAPEQLDDFLVRWDAAADKRSISLN